MKWMILCISAVLWTVLLCPGVFAIQLEEMEQESSSNHSEPARARKEIIKKVVDQISQSKIVDLIGSEKYRKNRVAIRSKILRKWGRYIPFVKIKDFGYRDEKAYGLVSLKISSEDLKKLLLEHGMLYQSEGLPAMVSFIDIVGPGQKHPYRWWEKSIQPSESKRISLVVESIFKESLRKQGFYVHEAGESSFVEFIPSSGSSMRSSVRRRWSEREFRQIGGFLAAGIYLRGSIVFSSGSFEGRFSTARLQILAHYQSNGRKVAEVKRSFRVPTSDKVLLSGVFDEKVNEAATEIGHQILRVWQKGTFGSSLFRIVLLGPTDYPSLEVLKQTLGTKSRGIKGVRERLFEPGKITLEADISGDALELAESLQSIDFSQFTLRLLESSAQAATYELVKVDAPFSN